MSAIFSAGKEHTDCGQASRNRLKLMRELYQFKRLLLTVPVLYRVLHTGKFHYETPCVLKEHVATPVSYWKEPL